MEYFLLQLFIFLAASAVAVPLAKRLGLGSVLGYLIAGIVIGPFGVSLIGDVESVMHFTEFGVVMMLFLVGLELKPSLLWKMRLPILGMGGMQVLLSSAMMGAIAAFFLPWQQALAVGLILSLSSTAIVLQTMREKGLMNTSAGRSVFSVLLFQDLAVIPMIALLPMLATLTLHDGGAHHESALLDISVLPGYLQLIVTLCAIASIFFLGKYASRPVFRAIASTGVREIFVAAALALVVGISLLMTVVGLSPALGTFLAGVVLADSEYRHELESDIEPFKGLLLGIFFISIGASLNFQLITDSAPTIAGITAALILVKWLVLVITGKVFSVEKQDRSLLAIALAQGGEFAFVLFQLSKTSGILAPDTIEPLISAVAISMFLTPLMFMLHSKVTATSVNSNDNTSPDTIPKSQHKVIIAGLGRLGTDVGRFLISTGIKPVIIDNNPANIEVLRKFGYEVFYGDITRLDLLESAGAHEASLLIVTIGDNDTAKHLIATAQKHFPHLKVIVNADDRHAAFELMGTHAQSIRRETAGSALTLGQDALQVLGVDPYEALRMARIFSRKDDEMMTELYDLRANSERYINAYQQRHSELETLMAQDLEFDNEELEKAWTAKNPSA